jgi:glycosyltransferase involved in cell wall biosynthesis
MREFQRKDLREDLRNGLEGRSILILLDNAPTTWTSRDQVEFERCRAWVRNKVRPVLVFSEPPPPDIEARYRSTGAEIEHINYGLGVLHYYRELGKLVRSYSASMAHVCFFDYFSLIPWLARLQGIRYIVYEMVTSGESRATSWKKFLLRVRTRLTTFPVSKIMAISEFIRIRMIDLGVPARKLITVYHGTDVGSYSPQPDARASLAAEFPVRDGEFLLCAICRLIPFKNVQTILEACALLAARGRAFRLFVAGEGFLRDELESLARRLNIADRVHWLGHRGNPERLLQACDVFLLASIGEAFGLVLCEAMACGIPVIAADSGGIVEIVRDGETGLLVAPRDAHAFADAIEKLASDPRLRQEMGLRGRRRVEQYFDTKFVGENTVNVYRKL